MIMGINSSKKVFFIWLSVFLVLFLGLCITATLLDNTYPPEERSTSAQMGIIYLGSFIISCLPIGWATRRKIIKWYAHIPTEEIKIFETNLVLAIIRLVKCCILLALNTSLFAIYTAFSIIAGPFINLYAIISSIIFMCQKRI